MLKEERQQLILEMLKKEGKVVAADLSRRLNVSEDTVRRDLRELDNRGLLHRVHGGALLKGPPLVSFDEKHRQEPEAKARIARTALQLVRNGQIIIIDGGTTTLAFAQQIPADLRATVVTNSPPVAVALSSHTHIDVIMVGGRLFKQSMVNIGAATVEALERIRADLCILGAYGVHPQIGLSVPDQEESFVKRKMIAVSAETAVLVTSPKLGTASSYVVAPLTDIDYLVTEPQVSRETLLEYRESGVTVLQ